MKNRLSRGFTLIELLVVIAIIGILSAVVLSQLNSARTKGTDASIKSTLSNAPTASQLYYDFYNNNDWTGVCIADNGLNKIMTKLSSITTASCSGTGQLGWRAYARLQNQTGYWCLDHTGTKKLCNNVPVSGSYVCAAGC